MRTNGLVGALVVALAVAAHARANEVDLAGSVHVSDVGPEELPGAHAGEADACCDGGYGCDGACDSCESHTWCDCLIGKPRNCHIYAGTEMTALKIASETGGIIRESFSDTTAPGVSSVSFTEPGGVHDWGYAPRFWIGAQLTDKWGVRGRYWRLSDVDEHFPDVTPGFTPTGTNFATFEATDFVTAWDVDVEAVRSCEWCGWKFDGFVGGRHADFQTETDLLSFGVFTTGNFINLVLQDGCRFNGSGVTYGGSFRRQLGSSCMWLFGSARGSYLSGTSDSFGRSDGTVASSPSAPLVGAATVRREHADANMTMIEAQAGAEFEWQLKCVPANAFFRVAYEYQNWDIDGKPTGGAGFGGTIGEITTNSFAAAGLGRMILNGVTLGTGLTW